MDDAAKQRLDTLYALWRRERQASRERTVEERRNLTLAERVQRGLAARDLSVVDTDASAGGRVLAWLIAQRDELDLLRAGVGDPIRLWSAKPPAPNERAPGPDSPDAIQGIIAKRRPGRLGVVVEAESADILESGGAFHLDRDDSEVTFDRGDAAIAKFKDAKAGTDEARLRDAILGSTPPKFAERKPIEWKDGSLNDPQKEAVAIAMSAREVALIHGPPGTGKTRTLVEVVRQAVGRGERVLVTAASNAAVDNLSVQLVQAGLAVVRIGHPARVSAEMEARTLDALLEASGAFDNARKWNTEAIDRKRRARMRLDRGQIGYREMKEEVKEANALHKDARMHLAGIQDAILSGARVICSTAAGADSSLMGDMRFDLVVLDEATQAPDPIALVALARGARAVFAGDPCQLPPTVLDLHAAREGLSTTMFERLAASRPDTRRLLVVQHRMHEAIMAFPSASMYENKLVAHPSVATRRLEELANVKADPVRPGPWHFLDTSGRGWSEERGTDDPSTRNPGEAERVAAETRRLLDRGVPATDIAIITPYDAQVRLLREQLSSEVTAGVEVGTVDGFQGREKEAVIVDLVRSNEEGEIGFLADTRRMNVALTRAKRCLLVIGDGATLAEHPYYKLFLDHAEKSHAWRSAWDE